MSKFTIIISQMGERSILIEWPQIIDEKILEDVIALKKIVLLYHKDRLANQTPAYASLLLQYKDEINFEELQRELFELYANSGFSAKSDKKEWHIPVCYHSSLAMDLDSFAAKGISHSELVKLHTNGLYRVYMIGFLPGFLYLGGLPDRLHLNRKITPNLKTPKGAIAIGGQQTGIYPIESPGGWHVIGRTPLSLFDIHSKIPTPIRQGDYIRFYDIDIDTYNVFNQ